MSLKKSTLRYLDSLGAANLNGKTVLITGANSGIGYKEAELLLSLNADIVMACRNAKKAQAAKEKLLSEYPDRRIEILELDLASLSSIDAFCARLQKEQIDLDVFVNNAGLFNHPGQLTEDGFELIMGTNYIGTYYLCESIMPYLQKLGHEVILINTISLIYRFGSVDYTDFFYKKHYGNFCVYARSKLCLARYTRHLSDVTKGSNIRVYMCHPGISLTPIALHAYGKVVYALGSKLHFLFNSPEKSALCIPFILNSKIPQGAIAGPTKLLGGWGYPKLNRTRATAETGQQELLTYTDTLIKETRKA